MKKRIIALILAASSLLILGGCSNKTESQEITPDTVKPVPYNDETSLPNNAFYIVHETKKGKTYYPVYQAESSFGVPSDDQKAAGTMYENANVKGFDATRVEWVNYNKDEGLIPTMQKDDYLIFKSNDTIPTEYTLEKFYDGGYTFGVMGLYQDQSKKYRYSSNNCHVESTSDAAGFSKIEASSIYFVSYKDGKKTVKVEPSNVSLSGTIKGLERGKTYTCDIRSGTEKLKAELTANIHYFSSAETYKFTDFDFITDHIARLSFPEYATTGYYNINGLGFFRYISDDSDIDDLTADDYNQTIYKYDNENQIIGTTNGYVFDSNNCLVKDIDSKDISPEDYTFDGTDAVGSNSGSFKITQVEPVSFYTTPDSTTLEYVDFVAMNNETNDIVGFRYITTEGTANQNINVGSSYYITYMNDDGADMEASTQYSKKVLSIKDDDGNAVTDNSRSESEASDNGQPTDNNTKTE